MADSESFFVFTSETTSFNPGSFKHNSYGSPSAKRHPRSSKNWKSGIFSATQVSAPSLSTPSTASSNNNNVSVFNFGACEYQHSTPSIAIVDPFTAQNSVTGTAPAFSVSTAKSANAFVFGHATSTETKVKVVGFDYGQSSRNGSQINQQTQKDFVVEEPKSVNISSQMGLFFKFEINQNKATEEANQEPVSTSLLPLTVISRILGGIPQKPHFYQLRNYSELVRKNLMSSWDCTFEETVRQLHSLQAVDFWVNASELWKTMGELQSLGYNVILLRRRLVELSDVMMDLKMSQMEIKGLKIKAENHRMEKSRIESVILNLQEMAKREQDSMERVLVEAAKMQSEMPKFDGVFAKLALERL